MSVNSADLKQKVAREAANPLYFGAENEYEQAKMKAAKTFGVHVLPTNLEVATEFEKIVEETEGPDRKVRLIQMRKEALKIMRILKVYNPTLIGSVWRGTIHRGSDIDVIIYHDDPDAVVNILKQSNFKILQTEWVTITKTGKTKNSFHIYLQLSTEENVELVVRGPEEYSQKEKCEIYGDEVVGLNIQELEKLLRENPMKQFIPS